MTEQEWRRRFAIKLSVLMRRANLTRRELADKANIDESSLSYYFLGRKTPNVKTILSLSSALGCTVDDLADFGEMVH